MKKIMISIVLASIMFTVQSQDSKPTKEQTIEYIQNYISSYNGKNLEAIIEYRADSYATYIKFVYKGFEIKDCILSTTIIDKSRTVSSHPENRNGESKIQIDLSKVEALSYGIKTNKDGSEPTIGIISFNSVNNTKAFVQNNESVERVTLYLDGPITIDSPIYKAFNYLRKLCGAPEPLKF